MNCLPHCFLKEFWLHVPLSVAQAKIEFQDTHLFRCYFGKPTTPVFSPVLYFMLPKRVEFNANKPSSPDTLGLFPSD